MVTVLAFVTVAEDDPEALAAYLRVAEPLLDRAGARIVQRFVINDVVLGHSPARMVITVEYPSRESVDMVFKSPEYSAISEVRRKAFTDYSIAIVDAQLQASPVDGPAASEF